jgi:hypothetical protein
MKTLKGMRYTPFLLALFFGVILLVPTVCLAAQPTVNLGTTDSFAVLAGSTITNTGPTTINGDVGLHPGSSFTGQASVTLNGALHLADTTASVAKVDLVAAYDDAAGRTPVNTIATELGGKTLKAGVYDSSSGTFGITGTLTLDAEGNPDAVFIFKTATTLITASDSNVRLINSARFCRVFWKVGSSATLGTDSHFAGHIFALTSITANTGATVQGQLLARNGAVTMDTNTITNGICAATGAAIHVTKTARPSALNDGPGWVTYTYAVTNPGTVPLSGVTVTDNKVGTLKYVSGDGNNDGLLDPFETWIYTARVYLKATTTNTVVATGTGGGITVTDTGTTRVVVGTVTGGTIPTTATPWYNVLAAGAALTLIGALGLMGAVRSRAGRRRTAGRI